MIDTHAHLPETKNILPGWRGKNLFVVLAGTNLEDSKANLELAKNYEYLKVAVGCHPVNAKSWRDLEGLISTNFNFIVAIGECGLDVLAESDIKTQGLVFRKQIELAIKFKLPLIIHSRKKNDECLAILSEYKNCRGVFHCYTGGKKRVQNVLNLGDWYFGFDGNLTYESGLVEVLKEIPKDRVLAETDSPYLTPVPFRGEENSPAKVEYVYKKIAKVWGIGLKEAEELLDANAKRLFGF